MKIQDAFNLLKIETEQATHKEIKKAFKKRALEFHPDRGVADDSIMKSLSEARDFLISQQEPVCNTYEYKGETKQAKFDPEFSDKIYAAIAAIQDLEGLIIEIRGSWVWVAGETKQHKDAIKTAGFKYSANKCEWYFNPTPFKAKTRKGGKTFSSDEIRGMHGSTVVKKCTKINGYNKKMVAA